MTAELKEIILYVQDMNAQVAFYQDVLGLKVIEPEGVKDYREFYTARLLMDGCILVLHAKEKDAAGEQQRSKLLLQVPDLAAIRQELLARGYLLQEIQSPQRGEWVCDAADPEGNLFTIESGKQRTSRKPVIAGSPAPSPSIASTSLLGRLILLLRENKFAIALEILLMLMALYVTEYFGTEITFTLSLLVMLSLWLRGSNVSALGIKAPKIIWVTVLFGIIGAVLLQVVDIGVVNPYLSTLFRQTSNTSVFNPIQGHVDVLIRVLFIAWVPAGFGEEFVFRGYFLNRLSDLFGQSTWGWIAAIVVQAAIFSSGHAYEGIVGVGSTFITGIILAVMFLAARRNLWLTVVTHGMYDTISFLLIFAGL